MYQNVIKEFRDGGESIFLEFYPEPEEEFIEQELERGMKIIREIVEAASSARNKARIKLRWPLRTMVIETRNEDVKAAIEIFDEILKSQCNVKKIEVVEKFEKEVVVKPNFKVVGPLLKDKAGKFAEYVSNLKEVPETINFEGIELKSSEAVILEYKLPEGYEYAEFSGGNVYIYTIIDEELRREAYARELIRRIQEMRKELDLDVEEFIESYVEIDPSLIEGWTDYIKGETRSRELYFGKPEGYIREWVINDLKVKIGIKRCT
jgi:isoleucyl-tRNA synthetase